MKKIIILILISLLFTSIAFAKAPKFKIHELGHITESQIAGETRVPIVLDYDNDGDSDVLIVDKHGMVYILENLEIGE